MQRDLAPAFPQVRQVLTPRALRAAVRFCMFSMARFEGARVVLRAIAESLMENGKMELNLPNLNKKLDRN